MNTGEPDMVRVVRDAIDAAVDSGVSLRELARRAGLDIASVSLFTRGRRDLSFIRVAKLCGALGLGLSPVKGRKAKK